MCNFVTHNWTFSTVNATSLGWFQLLFSSSHHIIFVVFSCASDTQCQAVTFDGSQCHLFYTKLPNGQSPYESVSNWYGECEEADTLTPVTVTRMGTTTTAEVTTWASPRTTGATTVLIEVTTQASTAAVTSSKTGKIKNETSCEDEG